jgi:teichuronic acid biosynthesis glycosyltransferase TuaG
MAIDKVSVITPSYNSAKYIAETMESVLAQTYRNWEMLIVDDSSSDITCEIVRRYMEKDGRIKLYRMPVNSGPSKARNLGIEKAMGRYIAFLDSDDLWKPEKLEKQIAFMQARNAVLSYTAYEKMTEEGEKAGRIVDVPESLSYKNMLYSNSIGCLTAVYDAGVLGKVFMPDILKRQDWGLWLRILKMGNIAHGINEPLAYRRIRGASVSHNKFVAAKYTWYLYRRVESLPIGKSLFCFIAYLYFGAKKHKI